VTVAVNATDWLGLDGFGVLVSAVVEVDWLTVTVSADDALADSRLVPL
jgi:hypothetical protein